MTSGEILLITAHVDGASRGNPGHAGFGVLIELDGAGTVYSRAGYLGETTNNQAEYKALLHCLTALEEMQLSAGIIYSDSELLVKQLSGEYRVKDQQLRPLFEEARARLSRLEGIRIRHIRRENNQAADALANTGIDWGLSKLQEAAGQSRSPSERRGE